MRGDDDAGGEEGRVPAEGNRGEEAPRLSASTKAEFHVSSKTRQVDGRDTPRVR